MCERVQFEAGLGIKEKFKALTIPMTCKLQKIKTTDSYINIPPLSMLSIIYEPCHENICLKIFCYDTAYSSLS